MATKDINKSKFDETTMLKLDIFRGCFREWFPVFLYDQSTSRIFIFDLFAGSGEDIDGTEGSPTILLNEAKGIKDKEHCRKMQDGGKEVLFIFNEYILEKKQKLEKLLTENLSDCRKSCLYSTCCYDGSLRFLQKEFKEIISGEEMKRILNDPQNAKFVLLDQYGFKQVNSDIFQLLINSPKTDVIFFVASSFIRRFGELPEVQKYFGEKKIDWNESEPKECHEVIKDYYTSLLPRNRDYYIHGFTMKKGSNYYGLIFCTAHTLGMEKFMKICWELDSIAGNSNCNVGDYLGVGALFGEYANKIELTKRNLKEQILNKTIKTNKEGLREALRRGCRPNVFVDAVKELLSAHKIEIDGVFNKSATNIHKVKEYKIIVK